MISTHIVIPVFNGWDQTIRCLAALRPGMNSDFKVTVVDHGSTDATKDELPNMFPEVSRVIASSSLWWTGATNVGIRHALSDGAEYVIVLNNDCVIGPDGVRRLIDLASAEQAIVAPVQRSITGGDILAVTARSAVSLGFPTFWVRKSIDRESGHLLPTGVIMGGRGAVIPRRVVSRVGLFAEYELPHYLADHDFYLRCRRAGVRLLIASDVDVYVDETRTSVASQLGTMTFREFKTSLWNQRSHRNVKSLTVFFRRNYPIRPLWPIGVALNLGRYVIVWAAARIGNLIFRR